MLKLLNPHVNPAGGLRFVDPDTDYEYSKPYETFEQLEAHVQEYRKQNKLPPLDEFRQVWENWICQEFGMETRCCPVGEDIKRNFEQYMKGAKAWIRTIFKKEKWVSQEEANRRAAVCVNCNQNLINIGHRMSQFYTDKFMRHQVGNRKTPSDNKLYTCKICTCILRSKVHYNSKEVSDSLTSTEIGRLSYEPKDVSTRRPVKCWQLQTVEENKNG